jgi:cytochrome c oxidase cbb3-type subunit 3
MLSRVALIFPLFAITATAQPANPFADDVHAAGLGKGIFRIYCAPCHGIRGQGGRGPDLTLGVYNSGEHDADLFHTISAGVTGTEMESYGGTLSDENIWRLVTFIRTIGNAATPTAVKGDVAHGRELFMGKGKCSSCHMAEGHGGRSGPNLSRIGRRRSYAYLRASIIDPSADITPGYATVAVTLRDGKKITGTERGLDNFTVQVVDLSGNFHSFDKNNVASVTHETRSLMPDSYGRVFTSQELDDLTSYLASLRGEISRR